MDNEHPLKVNSILQEKNGQFDTIKNKQKKVELLVTAVVGNMSQSLSRVRLFVTPSTGVSIGFSWQEYWSGLPFPSPCCRQRRMLQVKITRILLSHEHLEDTCFPFFPINSQVSLIRTIKHFHWQHISLVIPTERNHITRKNALYINVPKAMGVSFRGDCN